MENKEVVNTPLTTEQVEETKTTEDVVKEEATPEGTPKAGDKTPPNALLESLQIEREKRRELEEKIKQLETSTSPEDDVFSDEGKALQSKIDGLKDQLADITQQSAMKDLLIANPDLKEHLSEFEAYRQDPENKGMSLATAAKAFKIDKGLLDKPRKGLETATGGDRQPSKIGKMTTADVEKLRKTNYPKYVEMLKNDQIQIVD